MQQVAELSSLTFKFFVDHATIPRDIIGFENPIPLKGSESLLRVSFRETQKHFFGIFFALKVEFSTLNFYYIFLYFEKSPFQHKGTIASVAQVVHRTGVINGNTKSI